MSDEPAVKRLKADADDGNVSGEVVNPWRHACADVISFHLIKGITELEVIHELSDGGVTFNGDFFHQHFTDSEQINGYKGLKIKFWVSVRTYHVWIEISYTSRKQTHDEILKTLKDHFPGGIARSREEFIRLIVSSAQELSNVTTYGKTLQTLNTPAHGHVQLQHFTLAKAAPALQALHSRFEPLILFFIDGGSLIEKGDDKWDVLMAVQPCKDGCPALLGLTTLYSFWAYPDASRMRLSQMLVLPPFRDAGIGKAMLSLSYRLAQERQCMDLTLEDPTPNLQRVREKLEVEILRASTWVMQQVEACVEAVTSGKQEWPQIATIPPVKRHQSTLRNGSSPPMHDTTDSSVVGSIQISLAPELPQSQAAVPASAPDTATVDGVTSTSPSTQINNSTGRRTQEAAAAKRLAGPVACLRPTPAFLSAITREFKIMQKEARLVWEALLFLAPGLWEHSVGQTALTNLVRERLEVSHFATVKSEAERKQVIPMRGPNGRYLMDFIMMRVSSAPHPGPCTDAAAEAPPASSFGTNADVAAGRFTLTTVSMEEKEIRLKEMCDERWEQIRTLERLLSNKARAPL